LQAVADLSQARQGCDTAHRLAPDTSATPSGNTMSARRVDLADTFSSSQVSHAHHHFFSTATI
jgi:hypothetical protein